MSKQRELTHIELKWQQNLRRIWLAKKGDLGLSQETASAKAGWKTQSAFNQYLNGKIPLNTDAIIKIASVLQVSPAEINPALGQVLQPCNIEPGPSIRGKVPLISWVQAGEWCDVADPFQPGDADKWEPCPFDHSDRAYCLRVSGDSMAPEYRDGEIILVDPADTAIHGDDVIVRTPDGRATFKRLQITPDGTFLLALNPDYPNRIISVPDGSVICGVVTGSWWNRRRK